MRINRFEDNRAWQAARELTNAVYRIETLRDFRFRDQITSAAVSVMNNIAEGFDSQSNVEHLRFLRYARRSSSEVQNCLYVALDQRYIDQPQFELFYDQASKCRCLIDGWIRYLRSAIDARRHAVTG